MSKRILFQDTSFRDGFQSVFGARVSTRDFIPAVEAAVAAGIAGIFMEVHPAPDKGLSDAANMYPLSELEALLAKLVKIDKVVKNDQA